MAAEVGMARHNRVGCGTDQRGHDYDVSYQPDWLRQVKVTRTLESGRQSTKTLFRNPMPRERKPGSRVRTRVTSKSQGLDFEVTMHDSGRAVRRIIVEAYLPGARSDEGTVVFTIDGGDARRR
jgi:hypothetical protein